MSTQTTGRLFLIPNVLGDTAPLEVMPISVKKTIEPCVVLSLRKKKRVGRLSKASVQTYLKTT